MRSLLRENSSMGHVRLKNQYLIVAGYCCHVPLLLGPAFPPLQEPDPIAFSAMAVSTMGECRFTGSPWTTTSFED